MWNQGVGALSFVQATMSQTVLQQNGRPESTSERQNPEETVETDEFLTLLGDEYARRVIEAVAETPRSGNQIIEETGFSKATVYRRLDRLEQAGLVDSQTVFDPDGHHRERFEATFDGATCELGADGLELTLQQTATGE